jgi:hypothetical protein
MASNIVPGNIDGTFPKAGQDNSSQGFRDNFNSIKNSLTEAKGQQQTLPTTSLTTKLLEQNSKIHQNQCMHTAQLVERLH